MRRFYFKWVTITHIETILRHRIHAARTRLNAVPNEKLLTPRLLRMTFRVVASSSFSESTCATRVEPPPCHLQATSPHFGALQCLVLVSDWLLPAFPHLVATTSLLLTLKPTSLLYRAATSKQKCCPSHRVQTHSCYEICLRNMAHCTVMISSIGWQSSIIIAWE